MQCLITGGLVALAILAGGAIDSAEAGHGDSGRYSNSSHGHNFDFDTRYILDHGYELDCYYKTIVTYETVQKPFVKWVTKYKPCGTPYKVKLIGYEEIEVPVKKRIKVCH